MLISDINNQHTPKNCLSSYASSPLSNLYCAVSLACSEFSNSINYSGLKVEVSSLSLEDREVIIITSSVLLSYHRLQSYLHVSYVFPFHALNSHRHPGHLYFSQKQLPRKRKLCLVIMESAGNIIIFWQLFLW